MKIIGLMLTWNNLEFFKLSLQQALGVCDEVQVVEGCHSLAYPKRSTDGTCEYLQSFKHPRLKVFDFDRIYRYRMTQKNLRQNTPKKSQYWKPGNWIAFWDDDALYFNSDLKKLRETMLSTKHDTIMFKERFFIYNFKFNMFYKGSHRWPHYTHWDRISDGCYLTGVRNLYYKNRKRYEDVFWLDDVTQFHYSFVKRPERMKARWVMSVEKGTKQSASKFARWMAVRWNGRGDIFDSERELAFITGLQEHGHKLQIYEGEHPEIMDSHPWRYLNDVREIK